MTMESIEPGQLAGDNFLIHFWPSGIGLADVVDLLFGLPLATGKEL